MKERAFQICLQQHKNDIHLLAQEMLLLSTCHQEWTFHFTGGGMNLFEDMLATAGLTCVDWCCWGKHVNFQCPAGRSRWNVETSEIRHGFRLVNFSDATRFNLEDAILISLTFLVDFCHVVSTLSHPVLPTTSFTEFVVRDAASSNCASLARRWHKALPCRVLQPPAVCCCIRWTGRASEG